MRIVASAARCEVNRGVNDARLRIRGVFKDELIAKTESLELSPKSSLSLL